MKKILEIFLNSIPILIMIGLIPIINNDYFLLVLYIGIIVLSFIIKKNNNEIKIFLFGLIIMFIFETIFINTNVETFTRKSLMDIMPIWLPFLWGYGFVAIKRSVKILDY